MLDQITADGTTGRPAMPIMLLRKLSVAARCLVIGLCGLRAALPISATFLSGALIERIDPASGVPGMRGALAAVVVLSGVLLGQQVVTLVFQPVQVFAVRQMDLRFRLEVAELALAPPGISHLTDAEISGKLSLAGRDIEGFTPGGAALAQVSILADLVAGVACTAIATWHFLPLGCVVVVLLFVRRSANARLFIGLRRLWIDSAASRRRLDYWRDLGFSAQAGKEIRVFGLADWLVDHYRAAALRLYQPTWAARGQRIRGSLFPLGVGVAAMAVGLVGMVYWVKDDSPTAGAIVQAVTALVSAVSIGSVLWPSFQSELGRPALDAANHVRRQLGSAKVHAAAPPAALPRIRFDEVCFSYPGQAVPVLEKFSLDIRPGEVLAVVGVNGAGKTTMTKLLAGLYELDRGTISVAGIPLSTLSMPEWRRRLAVLPQGFVRYELSLRHNVLLGAPDHPDAHALLDRVAGELGLADLVEALPQRWDTLLTTSRTGGVELSGGQWQRVALARVIFALHAGRDILILDEPTAHLDAEAEFAMFQQVIAAARGATVILISHRLATVRLADRIAVLRDGRVRECGSHAELLANKSDYAQMFTLQADRFLDGDRPS